MRWTKEERRTLGRRVKEVRKHQKGLEHDPEASDVVVCEVRRRWNALKTEANRTGRRERETR
jgi:hypothetical protein